MLIKREQKLPCHDRFSFAIQKHTQRDTKITYAHTHNLGNISSKQKKKKQITCGQNCLFGFFLFLWIWKAIWFTL